MDIGRCHCGITSRRLRDALVASLDRVDGVERCVLKDMTSHSLLLGNRQSQIEVAVDLDQPYLIVDYLTLLKVRQRFRCS